MFDLLACMGLTFILKYGAIINTPRNLIKRVHSSMQQLFDCSLCLGFWSGLMIYFVNQSNVLLPLCSAAVCWIADSVVGILQYTEIKLEKDSKR